MRPTGVDPAVIRAENEAQKKRKSLERQLADTKAEQKRLADELSFYRTPKLRKPALRAEWDRLDALRVRYEVELGR
jgi:hypothetical protein